MSWDAAEFEALVSGRRRGFAPTLGRAALRLAETPYRLAVTYRNRRYDRGQAACHSAGVPVVSVGNLTLGGTGKTPLVAWLARWFRQRRTRVAILSRGYASQQGRPNDEALELEQLLPDVPHLQHPNRVASARVAVEELGMQLLLLDDGFQHRRLRRDLDLVLLDALNPFGHEHVFPRGMLREPPTSLARAHVVALSRADAVEASQRKAIQRRVAQLAPQARWLEVLHEPSALASVDGRELPIHALRGEAVAAFCGIGNPAGFAHTLAACGYRCARPRQFPDHHPYSRGDIDALHAWAAHSDVRAVVCTAKDLVKIGIPELGGKPLYALRVAARITTGEPALTALLEPLLPADDQEDD